MRFLNRSIERLPRLLLTGALLTAATGFAGASLPAGEVVDRIVAVVNGAPILFSELEEARSLFRAEIARQKKAGGALNDPDFDKKVLDQLINDRLVAQEIEKRGFTANEAVVDRAVEGVMQQNGFRSMDELRKALRDEGLSLEEYRTNVKKQIETSRLVNSVIRPKVQVTDQDLHSALRGSAEGVAESKTDVRMIFKMKPKATKKSVERLRRQIEAGIPFERLAGKETEGPGKAEGGRIGWVSPSDLQPELSRVLDLLKPGETSGVIETRQGFYLLHVIERKKVVSEAPSPNREKARDELERKEIDRNLESFVRGLREKSQLEVKL